MIRFEISYPSGTTHEVELPGNVAVLGRDPGCDVVLNDSRCSRRHAVIEEGPRGLVVRDSASANGVYVNGRRVDEAPLEKGDVSRLGEVQLKLLAHIGETVVIAPEDLDLRTAVGSPPVPDELPLEARLPTDTRPVEPWRRTPVRTGRPATVNVLVVLWTLFVPASVTACLFAAHRLGGGPMAWTAGGLASVVLATLGTAMALGLRALAPWARHLQLATAAFGLLLCPFTLASATLLLYLARPEVKAAFEGSRVEGTADRAAEATFALSVLGMLVLGLALTALAALVL